MLGVELELKEAYVKTGLVRFIFNPVLNHGDRSVQSHMGSECAEEQGQFWPFRTYLFEQQSRLWGGDTRATVKELAAEFGLEPTAFNACMDEQRYLARLTAQDEVRIQKGITGQPMFDVGGDIFGGSAPFDAWAKVIDEKVGN